MPNGGRQRPVVVAAFGAYLRDLRLRAGSRRPLTLGMVLQRLAQRGIALSEGTLSQYETGTVERPDPVVLAGLAEIYGVPLDEIVAALHAARYGGAMPVSTPRVVPALRRDEAEVLEHYTALSPRGRRELRTYLAGLLQREPDDRQPPNGEDEVVARAVKEITRPTRPRRPGAKRTARKA